ncbi:MAG: NADP-dependent malic enzyme [Patescibacteria group bacterium]
MKDIATHALALHHALRGKIEISLKMPIVSRSDLSLIYTPGVGAVSSAIAKDPRIAQEMTWRHNVVAVVSDGSAVLGLGNVGPLAALPVMEGKCAIFKRFAGIDAVPIVLATQEVDEIVRTVQVLEPSFGAIQLEDISAPRCFEIERRLSASLNIPVMHDDQHGTAIVVLAGLENAMKVTKRRSKKIKIVLSGAGAAGTAIAHLLHAAGFLHVIVCDRGGAIWAGRTDLSDVKADLAAFTNSHHEKGRMCDVLRGADVFIGISSAGLVTSAMVKSMAPHPIVFAMANPVPEIMPDEAHAAGAAVVATGRSDFPNQLNNALVYPGLFRGMLDHDVKNVTIAMKLRAAKALASSMKKPTADRMIPSIFDRGLHAAIARSVR